MNADALWILIPLVLVCLGFFATEAGQTILTAFRTAIPGGGIIVLIGIASAFIFGIAAYFIIIAGLVVWAMAIMGGIGGRGGNSNNNNWNNGGGE